MLFWGEGGGRKGESYLRNLSKSIKMFPYVDYLLKPLRFCFLSDCKSHGIGLCIRCFVSPGEASSGVGGGGGEARSLPPMRCSPRAGARHARPFPGRSALPPGHLARLRPVLHGLHHHSFVVWIDGFGLSIWDPSSQYRLGPEKVSGECMGWMCVLWSSGD